MSLKKDFLKIAIGILIGVFGTIKSHDISNSIFDTKIKASQSMLRTVKERLIAYKAECGHFPDQSIGLNALVNPEPSCPKFSKKIDLIPTDEDSKEFVYFKRDNDFYLISNFSKSVVSSKN